jgi:UDPglucose 6-dehydrogenase
MKIAVIGTGYVGLVAGTCFAETGNQVLCVDRDAAKIEGLKAGRIPIYEPGLEEMVRRNVAEERLSFTTDTAAAVRASRVIFIAVGTPPGDDGSSDLSMVLAVARDVGKAMNGPKIVVDKSTVPVGTAARVTAVIRKATKHPFSVVSNPEFLKEGAAIEDFMKPDRVVIGCSDGETAEVMRELYAPFVRTGKPILVMDVPSAELTKYAANAMLASRISFMNEIALLCEKVGANADMVRRGVGTDSRIGSAFLFPGPGYGGSCLHGRETVLVRRSGRTRLVRLDRLFRELRGGRADDGETEALETEGLEVLAWRPGRPAEFLPVRAATRRRHEGEILEVRTKLGRRVLCTPDHPFVASDGSGDRATVRTADRLGPGDWLPLAAGREVAPGESTRSFDLLATLAPAGIREREVLVHPAPGALAGRTAASLHAVLAPLGHPRGIERARDILRTGALRLPEARLLGIPLADAALSTARNGTRVPASIEADAAFWRVVGLYVAEGHCASDGRRMRLAWSFHPRLEEDLVQEVAGFWRRLGVKADVRDGSTSRVVSVSSRVLATWWLRVLGLGKDCYGQRVPDAAWSLPEESRRALLSGMWHGDGTWSRVAGGPSVVLEYGTVSRSLADGMLRLLGDLGVIARLRIGRTAKSTRDTCWLVVSGADQVERAIDLVKPADREEVLASLARQAKRIAPTGRRTAEDGSVWVRVTSVRRRPWAGRVHSLEVPGAETFVASDGLVVHNCFPKDVKALLKTSEAIGLELHTVRAAEAANERQKGVLFAKVKAHFKGRLRGKTLAVWGLAFKPRTDDMREAPSIPLVKSLLAAGARVQAMDPEATKEARKIFGDSITYASKPYDALAGADALVLVTEWNEFRHPDFDLMKKALRRPVVFDGRNVYDGARLRAEGWTWYGIGVPGEAP